MKKIFMVLAVAATMVACGGNKQAENTEAQEAEEVKVECCEAAPEQEVVVEEEVTVKEAAEAAAADVAKEAINVAADKAKEALNK